LILTVAAIFLLEELGCSNAMAFDADCRSFYHTDSFEHEIHAFDYDIEIDDLQNQKLFARFTVTDGMPDGLKMERKLWPVDGALGRKQKLLGCVERVVERRIGLPPPKASSLTFCWSGLSGSLCDDGGGNTRNKDGELAGELFRMRNQAQAVPQFCSNVGMPNR